MSAVADQKDQFENVSGGFVGVIVIRNNEPHGEAVRPGDAVFLTVEEQKLTANAHRKDEHNPFINGSLKALSIGNEIRNQRPIGRDVADGVAESAPAPEDAERDAEVARLKEQIARLETQGAEAEQRADAEAAMRAEIEAQRAAEQEEVGAAVPAGEPVEGVRQPTEEVGTPEAAKQVVAPTAKQTVKAGPGALAKDARPEGEAVGVVSTSAGLKLAKQTGTASAG